MISCFKFSADKNSRALTGASFIKSKSLKSGFKTIYTPIKPIKIVDHLLIPTFSFKKIVANIETKKGPVN